MSKEIKVGDFIVTLDPLWHNGQNIGNKLGRVLSTEGHILVKILDYSDNPVKCFRYEIDKISEKDAARKKHENEVEELVDKWFDMFKV